MEKMRMESPDLTAQNVEKIAVLFPNCITETRDAKGNLKKAIDFDKLRQMLSNDIAEGESYEFTWVGKKAAMVEANTPIRKTLRPCPEESKDWDTTQNLYIEGDNLDALKLLQESYLGKVKMIYIDPPYNTGHDSFVYPDNYTMDKEEYEEAMELFDEEGNRLYDENNASNPRFHSDWCSMIYSRLLLARNLLSEDGVIFISIDDNEITNISNICNEVFGEENLINRIVWPRNSSGKTVSKQLPVNIEYLLVYRKSDLFEIGMIYKPLAETTINMYNKDDGDGRGKYRLYPMQKTGSPGPETTYDYVDNNGKVWPCPEKGWRICKEKMKALENDGRLCITKNSLGEKAYWNERASDGKIADSLWNDMPENNVGTKEIYTLFNKKVVFTNPKPVDYIDRMLKMQSNKNSLILDFFSGSATTAHAVMKLNAEDGGNRRFIMVQLPEPCAEGTEAAKAGYANICEIGKERIRRAGAKIKEEAGLLGDKLDTGFRVLKVAEHNMKEVEVLPGELVQGSLLEYNIKEDRNGLDLFFGYLLDSRATLDKDYHSEVIDGFTVHFYNGTEYSACFDSNVSEKLIEEIARRKPVHIVFRDSCFASAPAKINMFEIFKRYLSEGQAKDIRRFVKVI